MNTLKLGTRGSRLALWQARSVADRLTGAIPDLRVDIVIIHTTGDKILDVALSRIGDKGLFTNEIENALIRGDVDIAVHSAKDLPSRLQPGLCLGAVLNREDPHDVLISSRHRCFEELPPAAVLGTSSLRRIAQIKARRPDIRIEEIRGNVETRIKKAEEKGLDGIILARAGIKRLGFDDLATCNLAYDLMLPAAGQGCIAVEARESDEQALGWLALIDHKDSRLALTTERAFLNGLQGGCQVPVACLADITDGGIYVRGLVVSLDGREVFHREGQGGYDQAEELGLELARQLLNDGAARVLDQIRMC